MTVTMPPATAGLTKLIEAAGDDRWPLSSDNRRFVAAALVFSLVLHVGIYGLIFRGSSQTAGNLPEEPASVEVVFLAPSAGPGDGAPEVETEGPSADASPAEPRTEPKKAEAEAEAEPEATPTPLETPEPEILKPEPQATSRQPVTTVVRHHPRSIPTKPQVAFKAPPRAEKPHTVEVVPPDAGPSVAVEPTPAPSATPSDTEGSDETKGKEREEESADAATARGAAAAARAQLLDAYGHVVWARIAARKPKGLRLPGRTGVSFSIATDGTLTAARIEQPSGNAELDRLALATVRAAAPFPPSPPALGTQPLIFNIPFTFR